MVLVYIYTFWSADQRLRLGKKATPQQVAEKKRPNQRFGTFH